MENVYEYREKNYMVLSTKHSVRHSYHAAVIIYLYYYEQLDSYVKYIREIPEKVDLFIITPEPRIIGGIKDKILKENMQFILRPNHGRDIAALLISAKKIFENYLYVCFVHDKGFKNVHSSADRILTGAWKKTLWENTLGSKAYIYNILECFEKNKKLGMLFPPEEPRLRFRNNRALWCDDFHNTLRLARKMDLSCDLRESRQPISIGTAFWCRSKAIRKLMDFGWKEDDFPDEPMPVDGTISHAIERIFPYVAQDAGFVSTTVMTDMYAQEQYSYLSGVLGQCMTIIKDASIGTSINDLYDIERYIERKRGITEKFRTFNKIYIYGAGAVGKRALLLMRQWGLDPAGFLETCPQKKECEGLPIFSVDSINQWDDSWIYVCAKEHDTMVGHLNNLGVRHYELFV